MKKIFIVFILMFFITGCGNDPKEAFKECQKNNQHLGMWNANKICADRLN